MFKTIKFVFVHKRIVLEGFDQNLWQFIDTKNEIFNAHN